MNKLKEKYEFVIGFVALIVSLSAFKDELKLMVINLSFHSFNLAELFFWLIVGYLCVLQLYVIPFVFSRKYPESKFLNFIGESSYFIFVVLSLSPIILGFVYIGDWLINLIPPFTDKAKSIISMLLSSIIGAVFSFFANSIVRWYKKEKTKEAVEELEEEEIKEIETAIKLIDNGHYAQSILELSKAVETRLFKTLITKGIPIKQRNLLELLRASKKHEILTDTEISSIDELRVLRNKVAHETEIDIDKQTAERLQKLVKSIIIKTNEIDKIQTPNNESPFFIGKVHDSLATAMTESKKQNKPIFLVIYDGKHSKKSRLDWALGYFMEYETTKKLVNQNFIQALVDRTKENVEEYIPKDDPLETCLLVVLNNGKILRQETVYANMDEGMKRVKETIKTINLK